MIVLAAGASARLGRPKQLLPWAGTTLLRHATARALEADLGPVLVVVGAQADAVRAAVHDLPVRVVVNDAWPRGVGGSIRAGVLALEQAAPGAIAVILTTCDQPRVPASHLARLAAVHAETGQPIVASAYAGTLGVPALFAAAAFDELLALDGEMGAKAVIAGRREDVAAVECPEAGFDVDTEGDLNA